jgi:hypothetical protein
MNARQYSDEETKKGDEWEDTSLFSRYAQRENPLALHNWNQGSVR